MTKVSILLCAYNAEAYIADAIKSTLSQTFREYEFIIIDDGSTDNTLNIIKNFCDNRIKICSKEHNYIASLNWGLKLCQGEYIARMDADDIMESNRLEIQVALMDAKEEIAVCTSWAQTFGCVEKVIGNIVKEEVFDINRQFLHGNFLMHPTSMIRRKFLIQHRLKYKEYPYAEDFKLWTDIAIKGGRFYVIPQTLLRYRISPEQITNAHRLEQNQTRITIQQEIIERELRSIIGELKQRAGKLYRQLLLSYRDGLLKADWGWRFSCLWNQ